MKKRKLENDEPKILDGIKNTCDTMKKVLWESTDVEDPEKILNDYEEDPEIKKQLNLSLSRISRLEKQLEADNVKKKVKKRKIVEKEAIDYEAAKKLMHEAEQEKEQHELEDEKEIDEK